MSNDKIPGSAKYCVAVMPLRDIGDFPDNPNPEWPRREIFANEGDITRIFVEFENETGFRVGPVSFSPKGVEGVKVYFNRGDLSSLFIVAESEEIANMYTHGLRLSQPYRFSRRREDSFHAWRL